MITWTPWMNLTLGSSTKQLFEHPFFSNNLFFLDNRAAMIWILGEYAERIDNAGELLEGFLNSFKDETNQVQLQILTAIIKLFLKNPTASAQTLVTNILKLVTTVSQCQNARVIDFRMF